MGVMVLVVKLMIVIVAISVRTGVYGVFYQANDPCRQMTYDYLTQLCCNGVIYIDTKFLYTCCGSNVCFAVNRTLADTSKLETVPVAAATQSPFMIQHNKPQQQQQQFFNNLQHQQALLAALQGGQHYQQQPNNKGPQFPAFQFNPSTPYHIIPLVTTTQPVPSTAISTPAVTSFEMPQFVPLQFANYQQPAFTGSSSSNLFNNFGRRTNNNNETSQAADNWRNNLRQPPPSFFRNPPPFGNALNQPNKWIRQFPTTTPPFLPTTTNPPNLEPTTTVVPSMPIVPGNFGQNVLFHPPVVRPPPMLMAPFPNLMQPSIFCDGINLSELRMTNPNLACCANMVIYDMRTYSCNRAPNGGHSVVSTTTPVTNDTTTLQPTTLPIKQPMTPIHLPTDFMPLICNSHVYYLEPDVSDVFKCCGEDVHDIRSEFCHHLYFFPQNQFRVIPIDPSLSQQRIRLDCGGTTTYIFGSLENASPYSC